MLFWKLFLQSATFIFIIVALGQWLSMINNQSRLKRSER